MNRLPSLSVDSVDSVAFPLITSNQPPGGVT